MYTEEEVKILYRYPELSVAELAEQLNRKERSIIGKLSRLGIYQRKTYVSKNGSPPISKLELRSQIENMLNLELEGLEKCPKGVLLSLLNRLGGGTFE